MYAKAEWAESIGCLVLGKKFMTLFGFDRGPRFGADGQGGAGSSSTSPDSQAQSGQEASERKTNNGKEIYEKYPVEFVDDSGRCQVAGKFASRPLTREIELYGSNESNKGRLIREGARILTFQLDEQRGHYFFGDHEFALKRQRKLKEAIIKSLRALLKTAETPYIIDSMIRGAKPSGRGRKTQYPTQTHGVFVRAAQESGLSTIFFDPPQKKRY